MDAAAAPAYQGDLHDVRHMSLTLKTVGHSVLDVKPNQMSLMCKMFICVEQLGRICYRKKIDSSCRIYGSLQNKYFVG